MRQVIITDKAPAAVGAYSQAIAYGNIVYTAGQISLTPDNILVSGTIQEEVGQIMRNLGAVLAAVGTDMTQVIRTTIYLTDISLYSDANRAYGEYMSDPYPARECVVVKELPLGARVEISMIAAIAPVGKA
jgi:2-iminobutanoate/2-iminopropanoate deaminase